MSQSFFSLLTACPLCETTQNRIFFEIPYRSDAFLTYIREYYQNRVDENIWGDDRFVIRYCDVCDFYWHEKVLLPELLDILYNEWISSEHSLQKQQSMSYQQRVELCLMLSRLIHASKSVEGKPRVLDFGGGWGTLSECAKALNCDVCLLEGSEDRRKYARANGIDVVGSLDQLESNGYDVVILSQVLEHIPNPLHLLKNIKDFLRKGGVCYITVPNANPRHPVLTKGCFQPLEHINGFTNRSLLKIVTDTGLVVHRDIILYSSLSKERLFHSIGRNFIASFFPKLFDRFCSTNILAIKE